MSVPLSILTPSFAVLGALVGACISSRATERSSRNSLKAVQQQIVMQTSVKMAEFRQSWINELRNCLAEFHSIGVTPDIDQSRKPDFYRLGTKDKDYKRLQELMYRFLGAETMEEKYACNPEFLEVSQDILNENGRY